MDEPQEVTPEQPEKEADDKFDTEEYAYLKNAGFSSEMFKIEIKNLPVC
jgi:hypothetical protein